MSPKEKTIHFKSRTKNNLIGLEEEIESIETDVKVEEIRNAKDNYAILKSLKDKAVASLPYPDVNPYDQGFDYDETEQLLRAKRANEKYWIEEDRINKYYNNSRLYCGHVKIDDVDYYLTEERGLDSYPFYSDKGILQIVNVDDSNFNWEVGCWRYPYKNNDIGFSRNITMADRTVTDVDVVYDKDNRLFSKINDSYLRNALIRNKNNDGIQSIIQTIQEKQDEVRTLSRNTSFIVQGCAGSGKTMVLLHRIRYLLFNNEIDRGNYIFLVPGFGFKRYLKDISNQFHINSDNIIPCCEYYRACIGDTPSKDGKDYDELVFDSNYLSRVYSREFVSECYRVIFEKYASQASLLVKKSKSIINDIVSKEEKATIKKIEDLKSKVFLRINHVSKMFKKVMSIEVTSYDDIEKYLLELSLVYNERLAEAKARQNEAVEITVNADDKRFESDSQLSEIQGDINNETELLQKASLFTARFHRRRLSKLLETYNKRHLELESLIIESDKKEILEQRALENIPFGETSLSGAGAVIDSVNKEYESVKKQLQSETYKLQNIGSIIEDKYKERISDLNALAKSLTDFWDYFDKFIEKLIPAFEFLSKRIELGNKIYNSFYRLIEESLEKERYRTDLSLFSKSRTESQLKSYLSGMVINKCKRMIREEFDIILSEKYKHYWFLTLYFRFLTYGNISNNHKYIFIDEAQDLSPEEIKLIYKINIVRNGINPELPVINAFGDINQNISEHGMHNWDNMKFITRYINLDENFRNPNQVTRFCNNRFTFKMKEIGVDLEKVTLFENWDQYTNKYKGKTSGRTFVVKDEYYKKDLISLLDNSRVDDYQIYTVSEVKGLEFKEVFVIEAGMTNNEKYISYTRALIKLFIISSIPSIANRCDSLIIQGEEDALGETLLFDKEK